MANALDTTVYVEPSYRAYQPWNPQLLLGAELLCDGGTLRAAADLCEQMLADDRLFPVLKKRIQGMLGLPITFEASRGRRTPVNALEAQEDWWAMFPEEELADVVTWGTLLGVGLGGLTWKTRETQKRVVGELEAWNPRHLTWDWQKRVWKLRVEKAQDIVVDAGDGRWMLYTPYGRKRPWAKGLWRGLSRWWLLKQYAIYDWGKYSERHGQGVFVAEQQPGISGGLQDRKQLAADLQQMARAANIALPPGYSLKLVEATANNWQTFKAQCDMANLAYAIAVLGNNLSTEVTGGSFAAASVHSVVESTTLRFTGESVAAFTHDQALCWWAEFNFGAADVAPWPHWAVEPPDDLKSGADLLVAFGTSLEAFARFKIPVDLQKLCDRFKVPLVEGAEVPELLELPPPPPSPFGASPGDEGDVPDDDDPPKGGTTPPPKPKALRAKAATKKKKLTVAQRYVADVATKARARGAEALEADTKTIHDAVAAATSYADLRARLVDAFQGMSPKALAKILHDATMMATLAGRASGKAGA